MNLVGLPIHDRKEFFDCPRSDIGERRYGMSLPSEDPPKDQYDLTSDGAAKRTGARGRLPDLSETHRHFAL
jgi:hypothetical protein